MMPIARQRKPQPPRRPQASDRSLAEANFRKMVTQGRSVAFRAVSGPSERTHSCARRGLERLVRRCGNEDSVSKHAVVIER
jgi:hypothetical protein